jgi:hypothetical protein
MLSYGVKATVAGLLLLLLWTGAVQAHTLVYETSGGQPVFRIAYPSGWSLDLSLAKPQEDAGTAPPPQVVAAMPTDGSLLWLGVWVPPGVSNFEQAKAYLDSLEQYILTEVKAEAPRTDTINGMQARIMEGTAKKDDDPVEWVMAFFQPQQGVIAAALYVGVVEAREKHKQDLEMIIGSLRPVN